MIDDKDVKIVKEDGLLTKVWKKTKWHREAETQRIRDEEEAKLRAEVMEEIKDEIKEVKKAEIKKQIMDSINGEGKYKPAKKNVLKQLGEEFKSSNIGSDEKLRSLLGGKQTNDNKADKILGTKQKTNLPDNDAIGKMLGKSKSVKEHKKVLNKKTNIPDNDAIAKMLGRK